MDKKNEASSNELNKYLTRNYKKKMRYGKLIKYKSHNLI